MKVVNKMDFNLTTVAMRRVTTIKALTLTMGVLSLTSLSSPAFPSLMAGLEDQASPAQQQDIHIKLDVLVGKTGQPTDVKLAEGQAGKGIFSQWAIKKAFEHNYPILMASGGRQEYWLNGVSVQGGQVRALSGKSERNP